MIGRTDHDDAVVGAGIIGPAVAHELALRGRKGIVFERHPKAAGASVRNFGTLWPIGQPAGSTRRMALRSLETWRALLPEAGLWHAPLGSMHLAYHDEEQVLRKFVDRSAGRGIECSLLGPAPARSLSPSVRLEGLRAALFSPAEICVDPREVLARLPGYLHETLGGDTPTDLEEGANARCGLIVGFTGGTHIREQLSTCPHTHLIDALAELPGLVAPGGPRTQD